MLPGFHDDYSILRARLDKKSGMVTRALDGGVRPYIEYDSEKLWRRTAAAHSSKRLENGE